MNALLKNIRFKIKDKKKTVESVTLTASYTLHCSLQHQSFLFVIIFLHLCHSQILVARLEAVVFGVFVVLYENTIDP